MTQSRTSSVRHKPQSLPRRTGGEAPVRQAPPIDSGDSRYRPGVGIMLLNARGEVFVARRTDVQGEAWQMPQGGIDEGEGPQAAALRELKEEIGTDNADIIAESRRWFTYDVPEELRKNWDKRCKGQRQKWFVMVFKGADADIDLAGDHPEFDAWRWASVSELSALVVPFKRKLYLDVIGEFPTIFRD
jgi:putative (di)nucleoside polyphosphate hydrolase